MMNTHRWDRLAPIKNHDYADSVSFGDSTDRYGSNAAMHGPNLAIDGGWSRMDLASWRPRLLCEKPFSLFCSFSVAASPPCIRWMLPGTDFAYAATRCADGVHARAAVRRSAAGAPPQIYLSSPTICEPGH